LKSPPLRETSGSFWSGILYAILLSVPLGTLDLFMSFRFVGVLGLALPFVAYPLIAGFLTTRGRSGTGSGLLVGGLILSVLITIGVLFLALLFSMAA